MINGIHHVSMKCGSREEYEKVKRFYLHVLGLSAVREWPAGIMIDSGSGLLEIFCNGEGIKEKGAIRHIAFSTDNVDAAAAKVRDAGYEVFVEPRELVIPSDPVFRARIAFCRGPLEEEIEFFQEEKFVFRTVRPEEAEQTIRIESICFPPNEACKREHMIPRIAAAGEFFLVAEDRQNGQIAGFINGIATEETVFRDEFFTDADIHNPEGKNIMVLGLDVLPEYRGRGLARELVKRYAERYAGRRLVLTCLESLVQMYEKFGFQDLGKSASRWGGESWHEMDMKG